jgi:hypothetical protein
MRTDMLPCVDLRIDRIGRVSTANLSFDRRRDVPEVAAASTAKPSEAAFWRDGEDAFCIGRVTLWTRRNPTTFRATRLAGGRGDEIRLLPHRPSSRGAVSSRSLSTTSSPPSGGGCKVNGLLSIERTGRQISGARSLF